MQTSPEPSVREPAERETVERRALDDVLLEIARDSREAPERYLAETIVPAGGE